MTLKNFKKDIFKFNPELHWLIILITGIIFFCVIIAYMLYIYAFAKNQVGEKQVEIIDEKKDSIKVSPDDIEKTFQIYKDKELIYEDLLKKIKNNTKEVSVNVSTGTLATTTKQ